LFIRHSLGGSTVRYAAVITFFNDWSPVLIQRRTRSTAGRVWATSISAAAWWHLIFLPDTCYSEGQQSAGCRAGKNRFARRIACDMFGER
jgi:hypothetical protein